MLKSVKSRLFSCEKLFKKILKKILKNVFILFDIFFTIWYYIEAVDDSNHFVGV